MSQALEPFDLLRRFVDDRCYLMRLLFVHLVLQEAMGEHCEQVGDRALDRALAALALAVADARETFEQQLDLLGFLGDQRPAGVGGGNALREPSVACSSIRPSSSKRLIVG